MEKRKLGLEGAAGGAKAPEISAENGAQAVAEMENASAKDRIRLLVTLGTTGVLCAGQLLVSSLVIRYAGSVIGAVGKKIAPDAEIVGTLSAIFGQLRDAVLSQPWAVPLVLWAVTFALGYLPGKLRFPKWSKWLCGIAAALLLLAGPVLCLFFTAVNGVKLGDIVVSLAHLAAGGLFEQL